MLIKFIWKNTWQNGCIENIEIQERSDHVGNNLRIKWINKAWIYKFLFYEFI